MNRNTINTIYLEKKLRLLLQRRDRKQPVKELVATIQKNIESLGYVFSKPLFAYLCNFTRDDLTDFYAMLIPTLRKMRGANRKFEPMYPNFPQQVMDMRESELYLNATIHYWSFLLKDLGFVNDTWLPQYDKLERLPLDEKHSLDIIHLGNHVDFEEIFSLIAGANTSISQSDKDIITVFVKDYADNIVDLFPEKIPMKENLTFLVSLMLQHTNSAGSLSKFVKTATDVLRVAVALSGGDVSLAENTKFTKFNRKTRRFLLQLLENTKGTKEEMVKYHGQWLRLGERLHPGEYKSQYPHAFSAFQAHRKGDKIETFASATELLISMEELTAAADVLQARPGEFARRLDHLFRKARDSRQRLSIAKKFLEVAGQVSTPVLLQVYTHFVHRNSGLDFRPVFPKGSVAKMKVLENELPPLSEAFCRDFVESLREKIVEKFSGLEKLGKVYVQPELSNYLVPFSQRSASKALKTLVRGSRIPLDFTDDCIRFFIHWTNLKRGSLDWDEGGRVDLDLSAAVLGDDFNYRTDLSYYNLKGSFGCHSGDITNAPLPHGASEFIDVSLKGVAEMGGRYIVMCVNSYTTTPLCDLPVCLAGWMARKRPQDGEIFEPRTVRNKVDLASNTTISLPLAIDVKTREVIWMDMALKSVPTWNNVRKSVPTWNNVRNNRGGIALQVKALAQLKKPNLYDLFSMHAEARGTLVIDPAKADQVFSVSEGITPFDLDTIAAKYL